MTLTELLSNAKHAVVLTGAGISTLSGIPNTGYYARSYKLKYDKETGELISKDEIARSSYIS